MGYLNQEEREAIEAQGGKMVELALPAVSDMVDHLRDRMGLGPEAAAVTIGLAYETTVAALSDEAREQFLVLMSAARPYINALVEKSIRETTN